MTGDLGDVDRADLLAALDEVADEGRFADTALIDIDVDLMNVKPSELVDWLLARYVIVQREPETSSTHAVPL